MDGSEEIVYDKPIQRGLFGSPFLSSGAFLVGILLFFMPFLEIKCNTVSVVKITGVNLATGYDIKGPGNDNTMFGRMESFTGSSETGKREPYEYALVALSFGIAGFLLSLLKGKVGSFSAIIFGIFGFCTMIVMMIDIQRDVKNQGNSVFDTDYPLKIEAEFSIWYFLVMFLFAVGAVLGFLRTKRDPALIQQNVTPHIEQTSST